MQLETVYQKLFDYYGPQNWWPGEDFEIAIGAILTQNTTWRNVEKALANLKQYNLLSPEAILQTDESVLKKLISPSGFFNQKANYLRNLCLLWVRNPNPSRKELLAVKGIGEETADSILLYLLEQPEFVIDAYTVRISNRLGLGKSKSKKYWKSYFQKNLPTDVKLFNEFHALLVKHAKEFCTKNLPRCKECFLNKKCRKVFLRD